MIRILFFIPSLFGGGAEKVLCNLVNHLDQNRFDITVITYENCDSEKYLVPGIHYQAINRCRSKIGKKLFSYFYRFMTELKLSYSLWLKGDYDIEAAFLECGATKVIAGSANKKAVKLAWVHCDLKNRIGDVNAFVRKTRKYYLKYDQVVCVAESVRESFESLFGTEPKAVTLYNIIDEEEIIQKSKSKTKAVISKNEITLLVAGRLTPQKKISRLLFAQRKLLNEGIPVKVWILGEGEERNLLEKLIRDLNLEKHTTLWGYKENPYPYMAEADILVCSSVFEGFSTFITEGLILGKPIVTTDVSGMREMLEDSVYGLITPNDDDGFYLGLKRMLTESDFLQHYETMAQQRGKDFRLKQTVENAENYFTGLVENKQTAEKK